MGLTTAAALVLSHGIRHQMPAEAISMPSDAGEHTLVLHESETSSCKPTVLFLGGLGQERKNDHLARPFLPDSIALVESLGGTFETISPDNPDDPELTQWTNALQDRVDIATSRGEKIILVGYSMGVAEEMQFARKTMGTKNAATVIFIAGFSGRDTNPNIPLNRPNLKKYRAYFRADPEDPNSKPSISDDEMDAIGITWEERMVFAGEPGDKIVPESQTRNLARLAHNAPYISLQVTDENGKPDSHLASRNSSAAVLSIFQTALTQGCAVSLSH